MPLMASSWCPRSALQAWATSNIARTRPRPRNSARVPTISGWPTDSGTPAYVHVCESSTIDETIDPPGVLHEQRALGAEGRVSAFDQVAGPGAHRGLGVRRVLIAQDVGVERGERVGVGRGSASEDETVAEIAQHDSGRVGPARASVNRGPSTQRRALNDHLQRPHDL